MTLKVPLRLEAALQAKRKSTAFRPKATPWARWSAKPTERLRSMSGGGIFERVKALESVTETYEPAIDPNTRPISEEAQLWLDDARAERDEAIWGATFGHRNEEWPS